MLYIQRERYIEKKKKKKHIYIYIYRERDIQQIDPVRYNI